MCLGTCSTLARCLLFSSQFWLTWRVRLSALFGVEPDCCLVAQMRADLARGDVEEIYVTGEEGEGMVQQATATEASIGCC